MDDEQIKNHMKAYLGAYGIMCSRIKTVCEACTVAMKLFGVDVDRNCTSMELMRKIHEVVSGMSYKQRKKAVLENIKDIHSEYLSKKPVNAKMVKRSRNFQRRNEHG